jgi:hypothetical protein
MSLKPVLFLAVCLSIGNAYASPAKSDTSADTAKTPALNEMTGTIQSLDLDNHVIRLQTQNGFNVEFTYDHDTICKGIGVPKEVSSLAYKDQVIIRYAGRDLIAREIEKHSLQPAMAASSHTLSAN